MDYKAEIWKYKNQDFTIYLFLAPSPLTVSFKLPVSEISEIDDHKSVKKNCQMIFSCNLFCLSDCDHQTELQTEVEGVADVC